MVDLSVPVGPTTEVYPGDPLPRLVPHATVDADGYNLLEVRLGSQTGTHVDAPFHVRPTGATVDDLDLRRFAGPAVVVDATGLPARGRIGAEQLEPVLGRLGPGVVVLLRTGWSQRRGGLSWLEHPFLDVAACRVLLDSGVRTIGIDAPSLDESPAEAGTGAAPGYPCHHLVAAVGGVIAENLTALERVDRLRDPLVCLFPVRLEGADGAWVRAVALELAPSPAAAVQVARGARTGEG